MGELRIRRTWLKGRYKGTTAEVIEKLREDGHDVEWWDSAAKRSIPRLKQPSRCGFFSVYLLEGDWAYTKTTSPAHRGGGQKYMQHHKIDIPVDAPCYRCESCNQTWPTWAEAEKHYQGGQVDGR